MKRPKEHEYTSFTAYTRAIEAYCDALEESEAVARRKLKSGYEWLHELEEEMQLIKASLLPH